MPPYLSRRNRAGQIFLLHPGEQLHAGVGYNGEVDELNPGFVGRVILYIFFSPAGIPKQAEKVTLEFAANPGLFPKCRRRLISGSSTVSAARRKDGVGDRSGDGVADRSGDGVGSGPLASSCTPVPETDSRTKIRGTGPEERVKA